MASSHVLNGMILQIGETARKQQENNHGHAMKEGGPRRSFLAYGLKIFWKEKGFSVGKKILKARNHAEWNH